MAEGDGTGRFEIYRMESGKEPAQLTRSIGGNGDFFNAFDKHVWNTTKMKVVDKTTGTEHRANARVVVLAASACETVRVLLNSNVRSIDEKLVVIEHDGGDPALAEDPVGG
mgnify:CR=1 FL=1